MKQNLEQEAEDLLSAKERLRAEINYYEHQNQATKEKI